MTYVTHPNPPANDDSQKIATTAWVRDITDSLEKSIDDVSANVSGGMFPKVQQAIRNYSDTTLLAPSGGTWWLYGASGENCINKSVAGGANNVFAGGATKVVCIKIA